MPRLLSVACVLLASIVSVNALSCSGASASDVAVPLLPNVEQHIALPSPLSWPDWLRIPERVASEDPDSDRDGISDGLEGEIASRYAPSYAVSDRDPCPLHGLLYRVSPHPREGLLVVRYVALYQHDCGARGHPGDSEVFSALVNPSVPPPEGILAVRAIAHQGTLCESVMTCGAVAGCHPCETMQREGRPYPVVYSSYGKHGGYLSLQVCSFSFVCDYGGCTPRTRPDDAPMVNAGESGYPMVSDLTNQGFVRPEQGWSEPSLMHFDPWSRDKFGGAGNVAKDLRDSLYVIDPGRCNP